MATVDLIEIDGIIKKALPNGKFTVELMNGGHSITAYASGKIRMNLINISLGDTVTVELSPYNLSYGRITWRYK